MSYKEFVLVYLTLLSGLACTNLLEGLGIIVKEWKRIRIDWSHFLSAGTMLFTILDFWFHSFYFPYDFASQNILIFIVFVSPPGLLFLNTLIIFPESSSETYDYARFFQRGLRMNTMIFTLFIACIILQMIITQFMVDILVPVLSIYLILCIINYILNSITFYKIIVPIALILNLGRLFYESMYVEF